MSGFDMHEVGNIIKSLRKQKGLTQADLAEHVNIDIATLSKIENGHAMPKQGTLKSLLEKLRFDFGDAMPLFLSKKDAQFETIRKKGITLTNTMTPDFIEKMQDFLNEIESDKDLISDDLIRQYTMHVKGIMLKHPALMEIFASWGRPGIPKEQSIKEREDFSFSAQTQANLTEAIALYHEALRITIPAFEVEKITEYYFCATEISMVISLADIYYWTGEEDTGINIYMAMEASISGLVRRNFFFEHYPVIIVNLCNLLIFKRRINEALAYANKGLKKAVQLGLPMIPLLAYMKGFAMVEKVYKEHGAYDVPEAAEAKTILRDAYHGSRLIGRADAQMYISDIFKHYFKTHVDGTPL